MPSKPTTHSAEPLAIDGGRPVRTEPLPLEFPGIHVMDDAEIEAVVGVLRSRSPFRFYGVDLRRETELFEQEFAAAVGARHALAVSSGTGALHAALGALGVGPGQEVVIPAYLWVAVAAAVVNRGAIPVLADIDDTFCLDPAKLETCIGERTAGIILVHMSGAPGDIEAVRAIADRHHLFLLEDCAQCNGGTVHGRKVGTFGDIACFSFQMNKNMTSGEGGAIVTNDERLYRRAYACHDLGYARDSQGRLVFEDPDLRLWGMGYRMDEIRASLLRVQLRKLPHIVERMHRSKYRIRAHLERTSTLKLRRMVDMRGDTGAFLITTFASRDVMLRVNRALRAEGIVTAPQGISNVPLTDFGLHLYYNIASLVAHSSVDRAGFPWGLAENHGLQRSYERGACPEADDLFDRSTILSIPSSLTAQDEEDIIHAFDKVLGRLL
jgi:dTDP-4-amino-4,6-dideoxygalactose transaminase